MAQKKLVWQIFPPFLVIILGALLALTWSISSNIEAFQLRQTTGDLEARANLSGKLLSGKMDPASQGQVDLLCKKLGSETGTRLTVVLKNGLVLGDSEEKPEQMDNHAKRPEIAAALQGRTGSARRFSQTLQQNMLYVAIPVYEQEQVVGIVRAALPMTALEKALKKIIWHMAGGGAAVALVAALVALAVSRRISSPLGELQRGAERFAKGDLKRRLPASSVSEISGLAIAMNSMAAQLDEKLRTVNSKRSEHEAMLASMTEGVVAVDVNQVILRINQAAARLLNVDSTLCPGRQIAEVTRKVKLLRFIEKALASETTVEEELTLLKLGEECYLQAHGTPLSDGTGKKIGAMIVLNDVTRLRRLENLRRDFVANVSHELKTPITAIKGAVETLQSGASDNPQDNLRFLEIAGRQADRLNAIVDDLLALSRLERYAESEEISRSPEGLRVILESALQSCAAMAEAKQVRINLFCAETLRAHVNVRLLEQAVVNLVDNAIKYSDGGSLVTLEGWQEKTRVMIKVQDRGPGIPKEHLPRLFERFYRVDAARSRAVGGTGLGLAIVKHIVQVHNGEITVHSTPGSGSVFTISLPAA